MSIITQALKKAQREQRLYQTSRTPHLAHVQSASMPRRRRSWVFIVAGGTLALGVGIILHAWLTPRSVGLLALPAPAVQVLPPSPAALPSHALQPSPAPAATAARSATAAWLEQAAPMARFEPTPATAARPLRSGSRPQPTAPVADAVEMPLPVATPASIQPQPPSPSPTAASGDQTRAQSHFNRALAAQESGDFARAELFLRQAISADPALKAAYNSLGNLLYKRQAYHQAIAMYQRALAIDPAYVKARNNLGSTYMQLAMHGRAIEELHQAITTDHTSSLAYYNLACVYARTGETIRAVHYLQEAIEREPQARIWARTDSDFSSVRSAPEFQKLLGAS